MYLISISSAQAAQVFVDYMATKGITIRIEVNEKQQADLYLNNKDDLDFVQRELQQFIHNPNGERYQAASWQVGHVQSKSLKQEATLNLIKVGPLTLFVTILAIMMFIAKYIWGSWLLLAYFGFPVGSYAYSEIWRWITPIFIHFSLLHILFNLSWWWYLGGMIERKLGWGKLLEITLIAGVASNYGEALLVSPYFGGLSGVVYALMGYCWCIGEFRPQKGIYLERGMLAIAVIWLIAGFTGYLGPIANIAHLIGLVIGITLAAKDILFKLKVTQN